MPRAAAFIVIVFVTVTVVVTARAALDRLRLLESPMPVSASGTLAAADDAFGPKAYT